MGDVCDFSCAAVILETFWQPARLNQCLISRTLGWMTPLHDHSRDSFPLNDAQRAAAEAPTGPLLIVAGAGTGKTRTLTSRMVHFIKHGMPPERICAITFTNKAAKEMADRVAKMTGAAWDSQHTKRPYIGTFHSLGARILRRECNRVGRDFNFTIFDDHDSFDLLRNILKSASGADADADVDVVEKKKESPAIFIDKISRVKNLNNIGADDGDASGRRGPDPARVASVVERYEAALKENNAFDFDDLIEKAVSLFKSDPRVLAKYQAMYDVVLVDEYQDINPKQHELIKLLAGAHRNITVVGDDEQTIYGWRYADIKLFLNFEREWPGAAIHFLEENYRSTGSIIRGAAGVVKNNHMRAPKNLYTKNSDGDPVALFEAWTETDEAERAAEEIRILKSKNKNEDIAILYRTNAQSRAIEQALIRRDIPYRIFGGLKFYERREIKDIVAGLRYAANAKDAVSRARLEKNLTKKKFAAFRGRIASMSDAKPNDVIAVFLEVYDYMNYLDDNFTNAGERHENVAELVAFASEFATMSELLERLSLLQSTDDEQFGGNSPKTSGHEVSLMTMHMAKGLEFDDVFLIGVAEGILPHVRSMDKELQIEEERRLMYVAMTRARKKLFISFYGMPSRFISEIPEDCIKLAGIEPDEIRVSTDDEDVIYY